MEGISTEMHSFALEFNHCAHVAGDSHLSSERQESVRGHVSLSKNGADEFKRHARLIAPCAKSLWTSFQRRCGANMYFQ